MFTKDKINPKVIERKTIDKYAVFRPKASSKQDARKELEESLASFSSTRSSDHTSLEITLNKHLSIEEIEEVIHPYAGKINFSFGTIKNKGEIRSLAQSIQKLKRNGAEGNESETKIKLFSPFYKKEIYEEFLSIKESLELTEASRISYVPAISNLEEFQLLINNHPDIEELKIFPTLFSNEEEFREILEGPFPSEASSGIEDSSSTPSYEEDACTGIDLIKAIKGSHPKIRIIAAGIHNSRLGDMNALLEASVDGLASSHFLESIVSKKSKAVEGNIS